MIVTDKLPSYGTARKETIKGVEDREGRDLNSQAEKSPQPTRRRERQMQRFKSPGQAQRFLSTHASIRQHVHPCRHRLSAAEYRRLTRAQASDAWPEISRARSAT